MLPYHVCKQENHDILVLMSSWSQNHNGICCVRYDKYVNCLPTIHVYLEYYAHHNVKQLSLKFTVEERVHEDAKRYLKGLAH